MSGPANESSFPVRENAFKEPDYSKVLVVGDDPAAIELVKRLCAAGYGVIAAGDRISGLEESGAELIFPARLESLRGFAGRFQAVLKSQDRLIGREAGVVALSGHGIRRPKFFNYGLKPDNIVISISQARNMIDSMEIQAASKNGWRHALILNGLLGESDPVRFLEALELALQLQTRELTQTHLFIRDAKVAAKGLEKLYRDLRVSGALFYKFNESLPLFEKRGDQWVAVFQDPELGMETELAPDLIVVDEELRSPFHKGVLADVVTRKYPLTRGFQPESVRFLGVLTPRRGVFAMAAAKNPCAAPDRINDAHRVMVEISRLKDGPQGATGPRAEVDQDKCAICLTCVRQCPHSAIGFESAALVDAASCYACGICVSVCPMRAITMEDKEPQAPRKDDLDRFSGDLDLTGKIVAFICKNSASRAMESASASVCKKIYPIMVPCAGSVDQSHILDAFSKGCEGALVMGCHSGNCVSIYGSDLTAARIESAKVMLSEAGVDPERLSFVTLASNSAPEFANAVLSMSRLVGLTRDEGIAKV